VLSGVVGGPRHGPLWWSYGLALSASPAIPFSVGPRDTPNALARYGTARALPNSQWVLLTRYLFGRFHRILGTANQGTFKKEPPNKIKLFLLAKEIIILIYKNHKVCFGFFIFLFLTS